MVSKSDQWAGAVEYDEWRYGDDWQTSSKTYFNSPGAVENYLDWANLLKEGSRGTSDYSPSNITKIQITGTEEVMKNLSRIVANSYRKAVIRLRKNGERILSESKEEVPWEITFLQKTGTIEVVRNGSFTSKYWEEGMPEVGTKTESLEDTEDDMIVIGYNTPYAARQHEDLTLHHPKPGRKAKYLEDPAMRIAPTIAEDIATALKAELGGLF